MGSALDLSTDAAPNGTEKITDPESLKTPGKLRPKIDPRARGAYPPRTPHDPHPRLTSNPTPPPPLPRLQEMAGQG